jgi:hypothetical protein
MPARALAVLLSLALPHLASAAPRQGRELVSLRPPERRAVEVPPPADPPPATARPPTSRGLLLLSLLVPGPIPLALVVPPAVSRPAPAPASGRVAPPDQAASGRATPARPLARRDLVAPGGAKPRAGQP